MGSISANDRSRGGLLPQKKHCNGKFIARTEGEHTFRSADGLEWADEGRSTIAEDGLTTVEFGDGVFVGLSGYVGQVFTSTDGIAWRSQPYSGFHDVVFGNGVFIGWKSGSANAFSPNGVSWFAIDRPEKFSRVAFGNGRFFALTHPVPSLPRRLLSSYDGEHWRELSTAPVEGPIATGLFAGNGLLLASEFDSLTSSNLISVSPAFTSLSVQGDAEGIIVNLFGPPSSELVFNERDQNEQLFKTPIQLNGSGTAALPISSRMPRTFFWLSDK